MHWQYSRLSKYPHCFAIRRLHLNTNQVRLASELSKNVQKCFTVVKFVLKSFAGLACGVLDCIPNRIAG